MPVSHHALAGHGCPVVCSYYAAVPVLLASAKSTFFSSLVPNNGTRGDSLWPGLGMMQVYPNIPAVDPKRHLFCVPTFHPAWTTLDCFRQPTPQSSQMFNYSGKAIISNQPSLSAIYLAYDAKTDRVYALVQNNGPPDLRYLNLADFRVTILNKSFPNIALSIGNGNMVIHPSTRTILAISTSYQTSPQHWSIAGINIDSGTMKFKKDLLDMGGHSLTYSAKQDKIFGVFSKNVTVDGNEKMVTSFGTVSPTTGEVSIISTWEDVNFPMSQAAVIDDASNSLFTMLQYGIGTTSQRVLLKVDLHSGAILHRVEIQYNDLCSLINFN